MAHRDATVRRFVLAAEQRYSAAAVLLKQGMNLESMYLAGYVVECATKALILARTVPHKRADLLQEAFRGRRGHDFEELRAMLGARNCAIPLEMVKLYRRVSSWDTDLRYETGYVKVKDAQQFLEAAKGIMDWSNRSM